MKRRGLSIMLALTALCVVGAALVVRQAAERDQPSVRPHPLFPELAGQLTNVMRIEIDNAGDVDVLERRGDAWTLPAKDHYPASAAHVAQLLSTIATLTAIEQKTSDPARYADLALAAPSADRGAGHEIKLLDGDGKVFADLVTGRIAVSLGRTGGGLYVRRADAPESWLAEGAIDLPPADIDWAERSLFGLADPDVVKTAALSADGEAVIKATREKPGAEEFAMDPVPPGQPDQGKALRLATLPVSLTFDDVAKAAPVDEPPHQAIFAAFDGAAYVMTTQGCADAKACWAIVSKTGDDAFNAAHQGWKYKLPPYRAEMLRASLADFSLKADPAAKPAKAAK